MIKETESIIPKTIHYCWFGGNKKSKLIRKCLKSWEKLLPEYKMIEWNEENFDLNICPYVREAYDQKKWAYVTDYVRFWVLNKYGGIYLDTDVEIVKSINNLLNTKFLGFSNDSNVATGLIMATTSNDWFCQEVLDSFTNQHFEMKDNPLEMYSIGKRTTSILVNHGLILNGKKQQVDDYIIYPKDYFNPTNGDIRYSLDERAYSIHHYTASWFSKKDRFNNYLRRLIGSKNMNEYYKYIRKKKR